MSLVDSNQMPTGSRPHQPLPAGTPLGALTVVSSTPHQLVLRPSRAMAILMLLAGILIAAGGAMAFGDTLKYQREHHQPAYGPGSTGIKIPFFGLALIGAGISQCFKHRTIDGRRRMIVGGSPFQSTARASNEFVHVQVTILPTNLREREMLNIGIMTRAGGIASIDEARTNSGSVGNLVRAAEEIARLLNLPLLVYGKAKEGPAELQGWVAANSRAAVVMG